MSVHNTDAADRFGFSAIPKRIFLDTNVINVLVKHAEHIFDRYPIPANVDQTLAMDIEALTHIFFIGSRANWDIVGSQKTIDEICRTRNIDLREELLDYALQIVNGGIDEADHRFARDFGRKLVDSRFVAALPDRADRELVGNAIGYGCDAFCTCDRSTIVRRREELRQVPLRVLTPSEWWAHIRPWAGLWC